MAERVGYYPGCSLHTNAKEYDRSCRAVLQILDIYCSEIADWNCCGASSGHSMGHTLSRALPLRNLLLAQRTSDKLLVPCAACYSMLRSTEHFMAEKSTAAAELQAQVEQVVGSSYKDEVRVLHPLDLLTKPEILQKLKGKLTSPLQGLKLAPYYGCLLVRPESVAFDHPEQPQKMDILLRALGAEVVRWSYKTECCGGGLGITQGETASPLVDKLVTEAAKAGASAIVTACPLCQANLEGRQSGQLPIFYFTELVGLALGIGESEEWFRGHLVDPAPALNQLKGGISGDR